MRDMLFAGLTKCQFSAVMIAGAVLGAAPSRPGGLAMVAHGHFDVRVIPQPPDGGGPFSRVFLEKQYRGDLAGSGIGHMLGAETATAGSGGYVALELVTATLHGRSGTFVLQHSGHMRAGDMTMRASIVPDSGTGGLIGLAGTLTITLTGRMHAYELQYRLPGPEQ
jgi:hypothetical protein